MIISRRKDFVSGMYEINHCKNVGVLDKWSDEKTDLELIAIHQILYNDGKEIKEDVECENVAWFLLTFMDQKKFVCSLELCVDLHMPMIENNIMGVEYIVEYLKMLMYVDKKEWNDFFRCQVFKDNDCYYLECCKG